MFPEGWKETQPANIVAFFNGFAFKSTDTTDQGIKWLKISNVTPGGISWKECNYLPVGFCKKYRDFLVKKGDVVVALTRPIINNHLKIGRLESEDDLSLLNQRVAKIVPKNGNYLDYIYHLFRSDDFSNKIQQALLGTDPPNLSMSVLKRFLLPLPPLSEQKKIAAILSTWDRTIEETEKLLANSQQQKKALMQQLLTGKKRLPGFMGKWRNTSLFEICILNPKSPHIDEFTNISFIPMDGVSNDARISDITTRAFKKENNGFSYFQEKDVLVAKITPCFENGKGGYLNTLPTQHGFGSTEFHVLRATSDTDGKFIYYITTSERFRILGEMNMQGSAGQKRVPKDFIERFSVSLPPLPEQQAIAAVLSTADEEITAIESDLARLRQEKKALMQQLLTGKRRVKVD